MDFLDLARSRRSIRAFRPDPIPEELLETILEAARWAPSAGNVQAWRVKVVTEPSEKEKLRRRPDDFLPTAPVILIFCADATTSAVRYGNRGATLYAIQDATLACCHALLAAADLGLGSCWIGAFDEAHVVRALRLPKGLRPVALLPLGWPAEAPGPTTRRPLGETMV